MKVITTLAVLVLPSLCAMTFAGTPTAAERSAHASPTEAGRAGSSSFGTLSGRVQNAATGQFLNNARISIIGGDAIAFTDEFGFYRMWPVPAGNVTIEVSYTGLDPVRSSLAVREGEIVEYDIQLTSVERYGSSQLVEMGAFVVTAARDTEGDDLAANEQRYSNNIKTVVATDSLGDIMGNNPGEFMKFLPGVVAEYSNVEVTGIALRGAGGEFTNFYSDGAPTANAGVDATRAVWLVGLDMTNVTRMEVIKVPTPSTPADSLTGSVNLVSKSAFERSRAQLKYGVNVKGNTMSADLKKTPHPFEKETWKLRPGFDFDYTLPISKDKGLVVTAMFSEVYQEQPSSTKTYETGGTNTGASFERPYLRAHALANGPRTHSQLSGSVKYDWRITPHAVLSLGFKSGYYRTYIGTVSHTVNAGTNGAPTPSSGVPLTFDDDFTMGATGRGAAAWGTSFQTTRGVNNAGNLNFRHDDGKWRVEVGANRNESRRYRRNADHGHFGQLGIAIATPIRIAFQEIEKDKPGSTMAFNNANQEVDLKDLHNYRLNTATDNPLTNRASVESANVNLRRTLEVLPFPAAVQVGGMLTKQTRDVRLERMVYRYNGLQGPSVVESPAPYQMQLFRTFPTFGYESQEFSWVSPHYLYQAWQRDPSLFSQTAAQLVDSETYRINNSQFIAETVSAGYVQGEARLFRNRLGAVFGVRFERTEVDGVGALHDPDAVWLRDASGEFVRGTNGDRVRRPDAGAVRSLEELRLVSTERGYRATRRYDDYYPSVHLNYRLRENLIVRGAYARTYGRPNFAHIIPNTTVREANLDDDEVNDPSAVRGTITVRNTGLLPWTADNYDLSMEWYRNEGQISVGVFTKHIKNFFGNDVRRATQADLDALGLDSRYLNWDISSMFNSGDATISGAEMSIRHSLRPLGSWGRNLIVFSNGTLLSLDGDRQADFRSFITKTANWGITFRHKRVGVTAKWNYRGSSKQAANPSMGDDGYTYQMARVIMDMNLSYHLSRRLSLNASLGNVTNSTQGLMAYGSATPEYARQSRAARYGTAFSIGVKGTY